MNDDEFKLINGGELVSYFDDGDGWWYAVCNTQYTTKSYRNVLEAIEAWNNKDRICLFSYGQEEGEDV